MELANAARKCIHSNKANILFDLEPTSKMAINIQKHVESCSFCKGTFSKFIRENSRVRNSIRLKSPTISAKKEFESLIDDSLVKINKFKFNANVFDSKKTQSGAIYKVLSSRPFGLFFIAITLYLYFFKFSVT